MSSRTVKWLLLASVLLIAFPFVAGASTSRVAGMGIQGDYIRDYTNVYTYLSEISCVGNVVYGELGNRNSDTFTEDRALGVIIGNLFDGKFGTFGVRLSEETAQLGQGDANTPVGAGYDGWDPNSNTEHAFDLLWGKKFGTLSLGLEMNRSYARIQGDPAIYSGYYGLWNDIKGDFWETYYGYPEDLNYNRNVLGFGGGLGFELSPTFNLEASVLYQSRTFMAKDTLYDKSLPGGIKVENDGSGAYLMAARGLWQYQPNLLVVPVFKYYSMKMDYTADEVMPDSAKFAFTPRQDSRSGWQVGLAGNWTLNQNDLFVLGATFAWNTEKDKIRSTVETFDSETGEFIEASAYLSDQFEYTESMMPMVFAALETHVNSWLTLRFGAQQGAFYSWKSDDKHYDTGGVLTSKSTTTEHYSPFEMMLGAGFKFGNLQLDATVNSDFVHNGPYFITGETTGESNDTSSTMFPKVTATYSF